MKPKLAALEISMSIDSEHIMPVYSKSGELFTVLLSSELWELVREHVTKTAEKKLMKKDEVVVEPVADWEMFKSYWDFKYPFNAAVECKHCGQHSEDWEQDTPKKFRLKTATLGGLVGFECLQCHSRVLKKHFKDCEVFECIPGCENE